MDLLRDLLPMAEFIIATTVGDELRLDFFLYQPRFPYIDTYENEVVHFGYVQIDADPVDHPAIISGQTVLPPRSRCLGRASNPYRLSLDTQIAASGPSVEMMLMTYAAFT